MYVSQQSAVASRYSSDETDGGYSSCIGHMLHTVPTLDDQATM